MTSARDVTGRMARRTVLLVAWARAWRAGFISYDEVCPAVTGGQEHLVADLPGRAAEVPLAAALATLSRLRTDELRVVLPAPGDPRGLPGPGPFTNAALDVGEGMIAGELGLVPAVRAHVSGSGDTWHTIRWRAFHVPESAAEHITLGEAEADLTRELSAAVDSLTRLDVASWRPELAGALDALRRPGLAELPAGYDARARRLHARVTMLDEVLFLADQSAPGGAVNVSEASLRDEALRPLRTACRRAVMAAINSPLG